jgi:protein-L-isoaspartate(D-aspartate) O-methyltransferase
MMSDSVMTRDPAASQAARKAMIDSQLRTSGVNEPFALQRMRDVAREDFLTEDKAALAYIDRAVPLGHGRHLAAPLFYGRLLMEAAPVRDDRVLVVSGGTGYLAELLRPLAGEVTEIDAADGAQGQAPGSDYTLLAIDGAIEHLPDALACHLIDGARIATGLVTRGVTRLAAGRKVAGHVALDPVGDMGIPVLSDFAKPQGWSFS